MTNGEGTPEVQVDFDKIRPLAEHAALQEVATVSFAARAQRPVSHLDGSSVALTLRYRAHVVHRDDVLLMVFVEYELDVGWPDRATTICDTSGSFNLVYQFPPDILSGFDVVAVSQFSAINGAYHAWPYLREAVQGHLGRLGLTGVVLPVWRPPSTLPADGGFLEMVRDAVGQEE